MFRFTILWRSLLNNLIEDFGFERALLRLSFDPAFLHSIDKSVSKPHLVEFLLCADTILLLAIWVLLLGILLFRITSLTEGDLSGTSQVERSDGILLRTMVKQTKSLRLFMVSISLQLFARELLIVIAFSIVLISWIVFKTLINCLYRKWLFL